MACTKSEENSISTRRRVLTLRLPQGGIGGGCRLAVTRRLAPSLRAFAVTVQGRPRHRDDPCRQPCTDLAGAAPQQRSDARRVTLQPSLSGTSVNRVGRDEGPGCEPRGLRDDVLGKCEASFNCQASINHAAHLQFCDVPPAGHHPAMNPCVLTAGATLGRFGPPAYPPKTLAKC